MRATLMCGAGDVRVENVPDSVIKHPIDALAASPLPAATARRAGADLEGWPSRASAGGP